MGYTFDDLLKLGVESQIAIDEKRNKYGYIGTPTEDGVIVPVNERGRRKLTCTLEDGTQIVADTSRVAPIPGNKIRLRFEAGKWVAKGVDERDVTVNTSGATAAVSKHHHNIGAPPGLFYPIDLASINDGAIRPTGNGLVVTVGRVYYPNMDGNLGVYDDADTLDFASAVSGLTANQARWAIVYILKTDGSVAFHSATAETSPLNTTTHLETAVNECLNSVSDSYPYHAVKITAGLSQFGAYQAMSGFSVDSKDFIRFVLPSGGGIGGEAVLDKIVTDANGNIVVDANGNVVYGA